MKPEEFLLKDYELKVRFLSDHFQRMWQRFNFFLTLETALVGGKVLIKGDQLSTELAVAGGFVAITWYVFGAEDRYLVRIYRQHVDDVVALLRETMPKEHALPADYRHAAEVTRSTVDLRARDRKDKTLTGMKGLLWRVSGWRSQNASVTAWAALFPLVVLALWIALLLLSLGRSQ